MMRVRVTRSRVFQKFLPATFGAKVKRSTVALGTQRRRFIHRHAANRVGCHRAQHALNPVKFQNGILVVEEGLCSIAQPSRLQVTAAFRKEQVDSGGGTPPELAGEEARAANSIGLWQPDRPAELR